MTIDGAIYFDVGSPQLKMYWNGNWENIQADQTSDPLYDFFDEIEWDPNIEEE